MARGIRNGTAMGGNRELQIKTFTPHAEGEIILPDIGYQGMSRVVLNDVPIYTTSYSGTGQDLYGDTVYVGCKDVTIPIISGGKLLRPELIVTQNTGDKAPKEYTSVYDNVDRFGVQYIVETTDKTPLSDNFFEFYINLSEFLGDAKTAKFDSFNALIYTEYGSSSSNYIFHSNDNKEAISALNNKNYCSVDNLNNLVNIINTPSGFPQWNPLYIDEERHLVKIQMKDFMGGSNSYPQYKYGNTETGRFVDERGISELILTIGSGIISMDMDGGDLFG